MRGIIIFLVGCTVLWAPARESGARAKVSRWERRCRALWYDFELRGLQRKHGRNWRAIHRAKQRLEKEHARKAKLRRPTYRSPRVSPKRARAFRVLTWEWHRVAMKRQAQAEALAKRVLRDLRKIGPRFPHRSAYFGVQFPKELRKNKLRYQWAARMFPRNGSFSNTTWSPPSPRRGMPGRANLVFGRRQPKPRSKRKGNWGPDRPQVELWWSGRVMPKANGPLYDRPQKPSNQHVGRWVFARIIFPYTINYDIGTL